ncbi:MAG: hypothetical protein D6748_00865 [Calditrichaeota bacterium]|nr:MAG: hypothetical protein D6748_00865 [Calditrichota bacterium]
MRRLVLPLLAIVLVFTACQNLSHTVAFQEMERMEYTRQIDTQKFIDWLHDSNPEIRLKATEVLGRVQDSTALVLLANRLTDEDVRVRRAAAFALGQLFHPKVESYIMDALRLETDNSVRTELVNALGKCGTDKSFLTLRDFLQSGYEEYQKSSAIAHGLLARRGYFPPGSNVETLGKVMRNATSGEVSWRCAYALSRIGNVWSLPDLVEVLSSSDTLTRYFALKGIDLITSRMKSDPFKEYVRKNRKDRELRELNQFFNSSEFRQKIIAQLQDSTWYVRVEALKVLGDLGEERYQKEIVKLLADPHPHVQIQAIRSLGKFLNWLTRKEMRRIYKSESDWRMRGEALAVLAKIQPAEALRYVREEWLDKPWPQNYYAIETLKNIETVDPKRPVKETDEATRLLVKLANSDQIAQTTRALEVLTNRRKPPVVDFFIKKLKTGDMAVATIVSTYFSSPLGPRPEEGVETLINVYKQFTAPRDLEAMQQILVALDSIGSEKAVPFLNQELRNPYPTIYETARRALMHITDSDSIPLPQIKRQYETKWDFPKVSQDSIYQVTFYTSQGDFTIELFPEKAPVNVANFVSLVKQSFFDGISFHRIIPGFVVQGGDPRGDGWGGPGYSVPCEYNDVFYDRGVVGIAHAGKDTGGSQFFITHTPQPHLNGRHTVIGKVIAGMAVVDRLMIYDQIERTDLRVLPKSLSATEE